jgi:hypothetical protein
MTWWGEQLLPEQASVTRSVTGGQRECDRACRETREREAKARSGGTAATAGGAGGGQAAAVNE